MIKDIEKDKEVTVLALQIGARGVKGDTLVTSDYAAVKAENTKGFLLADARKTVAEEVHLYTTAEDAIKNEAQFELVWNNEDGIDVAKLVATHKDTADCKVLENVAELGFEYTYELLGYLDGENKTSQSAHAALNGSMLRAQLTKDGQSVAWEDGVQSKATIGREPIVRVLLKEKANGNVVAVGYMKFEIVEEAEVEVPSEDIVNTFNYAFNAAYRPVCGGEAIEHALSWSQVEETIYTELGLSKAEFEKLFTLDGFVEESTPATQYDAVTATAEPVAEAIGEVVITTEDVDANMTEVLLWTVEENEAYELFTALDQEQKETTLKVNVRFTRELSSGAKHYVYVTFTWTPEELYINPTGSIDNATKLDEVWFTKDSAEKGFDEVHLNVAVPTTASDDNSDNCTYVKDLAQVFVGEEIIISGVDETNYPGFADEKLQKFFRFDKTMSIEAKGNDGKTYILTSADGIELIATQKDNASNFDKVAVLSKGKHPGSIVTYQDNAIAKALLNAYDHKELADGQTLEAKIELIVKDGCDRKMNLSNGTFDVKFLRPLSVNSTKGDNLQDALDGGDEIELAKVIGFTDWREFNLADSDKAHLFGFYGISAMAINEDAVLVVVNGKEEILKERYPSVQITYTPAETISVNDLGKFSWKNNAAALSQDVTLKLPVEVTYKWGVVKEWISVEVKKTIGQ